MKSFYLGALCALTFCALACGGGGEATDDYNGGTGSADVETEVCAANASWLTATAGPSEIGNDPNVATQTNCEFMQFSWQWFLALGQPVSGTSDERAFEQLNVYQPGATNQCDDPQSGREAFQKALFVRVGSKTDEEPFSTVLPVEINQAGDGDVLYDQNGNIVYYATYYDDTECQATTAGFLPGTMELKTSWRQITTEEAASYYSIEATIDVTDNGTTTNETVLLGLVGFHLVRNTATHPEFVWASFEHNTNTADCDAKEVASGYSFLSDNCAQCLTGGGSNCDQCDYNTASKNTGLTGTPDEVCRIYPDGVDSSQQTDNNVKTIANIDELNKQLVGTDGLLTQLPDSDPMAIWKNYFLISSLWTNEGTASTSSNQRGSLKAANTTMETFLQDTTNCFSCHQYSPSSPLDVSHIFSNLKTLTSADDVDTVDAAGSGAP